MKKLLLVLFFTMFPVLAHGATYYVAKTGSDSNSCSSAQSQSTPKLTIGGGLSCLNAGDTLILKSGTYSEGIYGCGDGPCIPNGTPGNPTIVRSEVQYGAVLRPPPGQMSGQSIVKIGDNPHDITVDGLTIDMSQATCGAGIGVYVRGPAGTAHVIVQNNEVKNACGPGSIYGPNGLGSTVRMTPGASFSVMYKNNLVHDLAYPTNIQQEDLPMGFYIVGDHQILDGNTFYNVAGYCGESWTSGDPDAMGPLTNDFNIFRNNICHDSGGTGILISGGSGMQVYNNVVYHVSTNPLISAAGIWVGDAGFGTTNPQVYNNTIYNGTGKCIVVGSRPTNAIVRNNICWQNGQDIIENNGSGNVIDHNLLGIDPLFVNAAGGDFHLQSGSPAIDAGVVIPGLSLSFNGSAPDLGALETGTGGQLPAPRNLRLTVN